MCLGAVARLLTINDEDGVRVGQLEGGARVPLAYVPDAQPGDHLLLHLGIPVEVVEVDDELEDEPADDRPHTHHSHHEHEGATP